MEMSMLSLCVYYDLYGPGTESFRQDEGKPSPVWPDVSIKVAQFDPEDTKK